ncbi:MAG: hypothetical protein V4673_11495 [Pseudomonadota bacterium]
MLLLPLHLVQRHHLSRVLRQEAQAQAAVLAVAAGLGLAVAAAGLVAAARQADVLTFAPCAKNWGQVDFLPITASDRAQHRDQTHYLSQSPPPTEE